MVVLLGVVISLTLTPPPAVAQNKISRFLTDEGEPPMSAVIGYIPLSPDSALVVDNTDSIFLIISDRRERLLGQKGGGSCEHQQVTSYTLAGDTLFVLDTQLGRITGYSIHTGECLKEVVMPELAQFSQIEKNGNWFYLAKANYNSSDPPDEPLLYRLGSEGDLLPLALTIEDLDADLLLLPFKVGQRVNTIKPRGNKLYFILPFSHRIWQYDTETKLFSSFNLKNESAEIAKYSSSTDFEEVAKLVPRLEIELDLFLLEDRVIVLSIFQNQYRLRSYSYSGDLIAEEKDVQHVYFHERENLYSLVSTNSDTEIYAIELVNFFSVR